MDGALKSQVSPSSKPEATQNLELGVVPSKGQWLALEINLGYRKVKQCFCTPESVACEVCDRCLWTTSTDFSFLEKIPSTFLSGKCWAHWAPLPLPHQVLSNLPQWPDEPSPTPASHCAQGVSPGPVRQPQVPRGLPSALGLVVPVKVVGSQLCRVKAEEPGVGAAQLLSIPRVQALLGCFWGEAFAGCVP